VTDRVIVTRGAKRSLLQPRLPLKKRFYSGKVRIVRTLDEALRLFEKGDVLVAETERSVNPDWNSLIKKGGAVILNKSEEPSNLSIFCREFGILLITQTGNATRVLKNGVEYTIDAENGTVYRATARWDD
jgi:pyruvate,water dikinase